MDPARDLAQLIERSRHLARRASQLFLKLGPSRRGIGRRCRELQGDGDEALLRPVVQITLDAAAGFVRGRDDAGAGGVELCARDSVRDRSRYQLRETHEPRLGVLGEHLRVRRTCQDCTPDATLYQDGGADR